MSRTIESDIADLVSQSEDIARQVRLENWNTVELIAHDRQKALEHFFRKPISPIYAKAVKKMIRIILDSDHQLIDFITTEKKKTFSTYTALQNNAKANKMYESIESLDCR